MNLAKIWNTALGTLQLQMPRQEFNTWLRLASLLSIEQGTATVGAPSAFYKEGLENRYTGPLREVLGEVVGFPVQVRVVIAQTPLMRPEPVAEQETPTEADAAAVLQEHEPAPAPVAVAAEPVHAAPTPMYAAPGAPHHQQQHTAPALHAPSRSGGAITSAAPQQMYGGPNNGNQDRRGMQQLDMTTAMRSGVLNARYTFDRFIVGPSNRLASAASMAVAEHPAAAYNPLFLYGGVGLGKTHLLHAIGNYALDRDPEISVMYVSSEKFTNDLINAIRRQQTEEFRMRYRSIDILLIDDIQFIAGKESTQEEFFHTFNSLHSAGKQIVISSDRPPKAILTLEERLRSRFEWGLIADVQMPDLETRTAILRTKAETMLVPIPAEVIDFLAHRIQSNIRELEGSLNRVMAHAQLYGVDVSIDTASAALSDLLDNSRRKRISSDAIIREVSDFYGVEVRAMQGRGRSRNIVVPRQVAMYLIREETEASLMDIGKSLGGRDHTTVMYGCDKIAEELNTDSRLRQEVMTIRDRLYQGQGK